MPVVIELGHIIGIMGMSFNDRTSGSGPDNEGLIPSVPTKFMAHFNEHCDDCERILGARYEEVNKWMDNAFSRFGPRHRFDRHHWEGVDKAEELFGREGRAAAIVHIMKDCGHIPHASHYQDGTVDQLGMDENFDGHWDSVRFREAVEIELGLDDERINARKK